MKSYLRAGSIVLALILANCSTQGSICSKSADCLGWNSARQDACEEELEGMDEVASEYDCETEFENVIKCHDETGSCQTEQNGNSTNKKYSFNCGGQEEALEKCEKTAREAE